MIRVYLGIGLFFIALIIDLYTDLRKWHKNIDINHTQGAFVRVALLAPCIFCFTTALNIEWYYALPLTLIMIFFPWWLLFDGIYNVKRNYSWWFNGSIDGAGRDGKLDLFLTRLSDWEEALIKVIPMAIFIGAYILVAANYGLQN